MKYCERVFRHVYIMPDGNVYLCSWNTKPVGNLLKQDLDEIWKSGGRDTGFYQGRQLSVL